MTPRGNLIALEGIDGSGKRTQLDLLARDLGNQGIETVKISFPRYESFFGKLVGQFLNGDFGSLQSVDPHFSALLYAGDRFEARDEIESALAAGKTVLSDRYIASNLAHQTARVAAPGRNDFLKWLKHLEYEIYKLPAEDLVIYLRVPADEAQRLVGLKAARNYTALQRDILEADIRHLEQASAIYDTLATDTNWFRIECLDPSTGKLAAPEEIHNNVKSVVETHIMRQASHVAVKATPDIPRR